MASIGSVDPWTKLAQFKVQRRSFNDELFVEGNKLCQSVLGRKPVVVFDDEDFLHKTMEKFDCQVPGCMKSFQTLLEYEGHYNTSHRFVCSTCRKRLPSSHLLDLHISETHDSYFQALAERKPMFQCYVETCQTKFSTTKERRSHCIEAHKFPPDFRYGDKKKPGKPQQKGAKSESSKMDEDSHSSSASKPEKPSARSIGFGHGASRGFAKGRGGGHWHQRGRGIKKESGPTEVTMTELGDALPSMDE